MTALLQQLDIFELHPLITNLHSKLSAISEYDARKQLLCLVSEENDIVLRYTSETQEVLKLLSWFRRTRRVIHDVCFDPSGTWLLVLCFDNTLHIVPALAVVDKTFMEETATAHNSHHHQQQQQPYSTTQVTSYIIPFVGPHECPNSKKCPNHKLGKPKSGAAAKTLPTEPAQSDAEQLAEHFENLKVETDQQEKEKLEQSAENVEKSQEPVEEQEAEANIAAFSHDVPASMLTSRGKFAPQNLDKTGNSQVMATSFMASNTCPYPLSVVWWQTVDGMNRAIIGYSDGSICFVGLSPNCPFVASTAIENGSVVKLLICKDCSLESVILLITSSLKQQFKLLLEQKAIKYTYPGDISPTTSQARESDWQIVMAVKANTNNANAPLEIEQVDEVFLSTDEPQPTTHAVTATTVTSVAVKSAPLLPAAKPLTRIQTQPPPPYSVAISRHTDSAATTATAVPTTTQPATTTAVAAPVSTAAPISSNAAAAAGLRFQQQQLPLDDFSTQAGILPAARARLASLKSLGTKKLNAIKMRLSDNRQKLEEYMPDNTLSSFTIMDSPSLTPEVLSNSIGSFYTIQNLRSTYLLSALHSNSNSLTVHSIDINLKPLFLYKIPKHCFDILISSNILYAIQYVDIKEQTSQLASFELNTEKENRDTDIEKEDNYATTSTEEKLADVADLNEPDISGADSADTSGTTSGPTPSGCMTPSNSVNAVGVISSAMASLRTGDEDKFNAASQLALFRFEHETVLNLYQMATYRNIGDSTDAITKEDKAKAFDYKDIHTAMDYVEFYETANVKAEYSLRQMEIMQNEFPKINYDPCYVVTNRNVYYIQLKKEPFAIFLDAALASEWTQCRDFCNTFDLPFEMCIEFAGDYLLRRKKVTQALLTYNIARIKPIRTALKLAMFGHTCALMHLCAMALKMVYILKSQHFSHPIIATLLEDITYRHSEDVRQILPEKASVYSAKAGEINECLRVSDYTYGVDDSISSLQMSPSSQFHLANLLLITLAEKAVNDKNYLPLWNFLVTNTKYHTNMTSIVLCQSGLFSAALILAKMRGVCIDTFLALTSVVGQEFGWYSEMNVCLYNLSELLFAETITYLPLISLDYFAFIQEKIEHIRQINLKRLAQQLDPFSAVLRPIVSHTSGGLNDNNTYLFEFCKNLIETYLAVLIHMESQRSKREHIVNALSTFRITYEDNQFAIETSRFKPISAGCAHCACVVDGIAYFWGSNGVPCNYSVNKSSDPPEPPHAVKHLELLSQLNLEVHAVKCGRQHTLVLTNNGLYACGNNNLSQLGIGKHMHMSLQPMLVKAFDGKNITIIEAGQYHNAAVADGLLYTWGWGVYGQLGHGNTETVSAPKVVSFFKSKKVIQVSLGHAHSLVLCQHGQSDGSHSTELYVFGSNHFGQLGIGAGNDSSTENSNPSADDELHCATQVKSVLPVKLLVSTARIRLIHTKFFSNLAVDENERMYTWGSSPQALRLANQIKRRAHAKLKSEELQKREMSRRFEATLTAAPESGASSDAKLSSADESLTSASLTTTVIAETVNVANQMADIICEEQPVLVVDEDESILVTRSAANELNVVDTSKVQVGSKVTITEGSMPAEKPETLCDDIKESCVSIEIVEDSIETSNKNSQKLSLLTSESSIEQLKPEGTQSKTQFMQQQQQQQHQQQSRQTQFPTEASPCEHMTPQLVDTTEVAGQILQISSGLFHFALISSSCTLYTWGKNLEHQLGTSDKERRAVNKPAPIDTIESPMYVDCGADFTLVMTTEYLVKAFGGNSNGQCGRDLGPSLDKMKPRVVCLPTTKRLMRFESQCVDVPIEINLPRPSIRLDTEPVRYLKSIPRYQKQFMQEAVINFEDGNFERPSPSHQYKSTTHDADSSENAVTGQDSDDMISSLENLSNNDVSSLNLSPCHSDTPTAATTAGMLEKSDCATHEHEQKATTAVAVAVARMGSVEKCDCTADEYTLLPVNADISGAQPEPAAATKPVDDTPSTLTTAGVEAEAVELQQLRHYIHYCLYVFHGLYNPDKVRDFSKERLEYRIRTLMLNFKFIDAFKLSLQDCDTASKTLKIFEYFTKDTGYVPMRRQDLKYLIYYLLLHFLVRKFDMLECERFFLADLNFYLLELAYVLYFNNNNTELEQNLNQKFKSLIAQEDPNQNELAQEHKLEETDVIFDSLSVKFKTIVCQRLMRHCSN